MKKILTLLLVLFIGSESYSQVTLCSNDPPNQTTSLNGFFLYKCATLPPLSTWVTGAANNAVETGQTFQYVIWYTIPNVATNVVITDEIPPALTILNMVPAGNINTSTNVVTYSVPSGTTPNTSHSITINVKFPEGITCNGIIATNKARITATELPGALETPAITVIAYAVNPFVINKYAYLPALGGIYQGVYDGSVTYQLMISKPQPYYYQTIGQQMLTINKIIDNIPNGATLVSHSPNCTAVQTNSTTIEIIPSPPNLVLDGSQLTPYYYCEITIHYPGTSFVQGSTVTNSAYYTGTSCGNAVSVPTTTALKINLGGASPGAVDEKTHYITNPVPGCSGFYRLKVVNSGNCGLGPYTIEDQIPFNQIQVDRIEFRNTCSFPLPVTLIINGSPANPPMQFTNPQNGYVWYNSTNSVIQTIKIILGDAVNQLSPQMEYDYLIYFTINPNLIGLPDIINNATYNCSQLTPASKLVTDKFTIEQRQPKLCLNKSVCSPKASYMYGDYVTYRLRIENNGSGNLVNAVVTDLLDANLQFVSGSEKHYSSTNADPPCGSVPNWNINNASLSGAGQTLLTWNISSLPPFCSVTYTQYGDGCDPPGVTYYFIEFQVQVKNNAPAGSLLNSFSVSGGGLVQSPKTSNTAYITINNVFGALAEKFVSVDNGMTWSKNAVAHSNSNVLFRLQLTNLSNYPVRDIILMDLLPIDFTSSGANTDDRKILDRQNANNRGSQYNITYSTSDLPAINVVTSPISTLTFTLPVVSVINADNICTPELKYTPLTSPPCNTFSWQSGTGKNVKFEFGSNNLLPPWAKLTCDFKVHIPSSTTPQLKACNDFAVKSTGSFLINSVPTTVDNIATASDIACVTYVPDSTGGNSISTCDTCCRSFAIHVASSVVKMGQNWYIHSTLGTGQTHKITAIRADLINFYLNEQPGCERCISSNVFFGSMLPTNNPGPYETSQIDWNPPNGSWVSPFLNTYAGSPINCSLHEFVWHKMINGQYMSRRYLSNEEVYIRVVFPKGFENQCCKDTINFCIRWSFTDTTCRTCDTLICYSVYPEPWQGNNQHQPLNMNEKVPGNPESIHPKEHKGKKAKNELIEETPQSTINEFKYPGNKNPGDSAAGPGYSLPQDTLIKFIKNSQPLKEK